MCGLLLPPPLLHLALLCLVFVGAFCIFAPFVCVCEREGALRVWSVGNVAMRALSVCVFVCLCVLYFG